MSYVQRYQYSVKCSDGKNLAKDAAAAADDDDDADDDGCDITDGFFVVKRDKCVDKRQRDDDLEQQRDGGVQPLEHRRRQRYNSCVHYRRARRAVSFYILLKIISYLNFRFSLALLAVLITL